LIDRSQVRRGDSATANNGISNFLDKSHRNCPFSTKS
jgi:hypothetical protein